jgi:curved DNA-binding protein CbpA
LNGSSFVDFYDVLQISPNADDDTIQQMFRHLAKKWHPDNPKGDNERFTLVVEAHKTLTNPEKRAAYDLRYQRFWESRWGLAADASDGRIVSSDSEVRESLLSLYYVQRRSKMNDPGLGEMEVARLIRIPIHLVEFQIWYLKEKGWIQRLENGKFALTALGVDEVEKNRLRLHPDRLIPANVQIPENESRESDLGPKGSLTVGGESSE